MLPLCQVPTMGWLQFVSCVRARLSFYKKKNNININNQPNKLRANGKLVSMCSFNFGSGHFYSRIKIIKQHLHISKHSVNTETFVIAYLYVFYLLFD